MKINQQAPRENLKSPQPNGCPTLASFTRSDHFSLVGGNEQLPVEPQFELSSLVELQIAVGEHSGA
jgi:hypothetical protein